MRIIITIFLCMIVSVCAQAQQLVQPCTNVTTNGTTTCTPTSSLNPLQVTGSISATNPSVGTNTATAPTSSTEIGTIDGGGHLQGVSVNNPVPDNIAQIAGATVGTAASGIMKVGLTDGSGNAIGSTTGALNVAGTIVSGPGYETTTGTITNSSTTITLAVKQYSTVIIQTTGTYAGITENFKESFDNGTTYQPIPMSLISTTANAPVTSVALATNASVVYQANLEGATNYEVVSSAYTSGTANVVITATTNPITNYVNTAIVNTPTVVDTQATASSLNAQVVGPAASGASATGNPLQNGGVANTTEPTAVSAGQIIALYLDKVGKIIMSPFAARENYLSGTASSTGTSSTALIASAGGSLKIYPTGFYCSNSGATATEVSFQNGSGGTTIWSMQVPAGGGNNEPLSTPVIGMSAATGLYFASGSSTSTLFCNATAYSGY